jgi:hypothetical protein
MNTVSADMKGIRQQLSDINNGPLEDQEKHVSDLLVNHQSLTCDLVQKTPSDGKKFQCFAFALGVDKNEEVSAHQRKIFQKLGSGWRGLADLLEDRKLAWIKNPHDRCDGDVCFYFDGTVTEDTSYDAQALHCLGVKHAGRVHGTHILSKWGNGHIWKHDIDVIPSTYENQHREMSVLFFRILVPSQDIAEFLLGFYVRNTVRFRPQPIFVC